MKRTILITSLLILFIGCKKVEIENEDYEQLKETEMAILPETNITTTMVGDTLGTSSKNVGALCTHPDINMWSRRKPVRDPRLTVPLDDVGRVGVPSESNSWGLDLGVPSIDGSSLTIYNRPRGGVGEPFRLGDFRGYAHDATPPIVLGRSPAYLRKKTEFILVAISKDSQTGIPFNHLWGGLRVGVIVYNNGIPFNSASAKDPGGGAILIDLSGLQASAITVRFGLTNVYKDWYNTGGLNFLYDLPRSNVNENQNWVNVPLKASTYYPPGSGEEGGDFIRSDVNSNMDFINGRILWIALDEKEFDGIFESRGVTNFKAKYYSGLHVAEPGSHVTPYREFSFTRAQMAIDTPQYDFGRYNYNKPNFYVSSTIGLIAEFEFTLFVDYYDPISDRWRRFGFSQSRTFIDPNPPEH